jgi:IS5 family transposase
MIMLVIRASVPQESSIEGYIQGLEKDRELVILDEVMDDKELLDRVAGVFPEKDVGRHRLPVEVTLRCTYWKTRYGLSYRELAHALLVNVEAQWFCRVRKEGGLPSFSCLHQNIAQLDEETWKQINKWIVTKARQKHHTKGLKCRKDSTVVEANVRYPTDGGILIDGIRTVVREVKTVVGKALPKGFRSFQHKVKEARNTLRRVGKGGTEKVYEVLEALCGMAQHVVRTSREVGGEQVEVVVDRLEQVVTQTRQVIAGVKHLPHRIVSFFEEYARPIVKGKAGVSCEFGLGVQLQEDELLIVDWECQETLDDVGSLERGLDRFEELHGHPPKAFTADGQYASEQAKTWEKLKARGIAEVSIPFRGKEKAKYGGNRFWALQRWRSGSEGTISVLKRMRGLGKIRERGEAGFRRGVGMGIVTQNWVRLARAMG